MLRHSRLLARICVMSLLAQLVGLVLPLLTGAVVDRVVPRSDLHLLQVITIGVAMAAMFYFLTAYLRSQLLLHLRTHLDLQMTLDFVDHVVRLPFAFFQLRQTGDLVMRLNSNTTIRETLTSGALSAVLDGILVTSYLAILLTTHRGLGLLVVALGLLRVTIYALSSRRLQSLTAEGLQAQAAASNYQVQMLEGIETVKAAGTERWTVEQLSHLLVNVTNISLKRARLLAVVDALLAALGVASAALILCGGAWLVLQKQLSLGTMLAMGALAAGFLNPLSSLVSVALQFQTLNSLIERVDDVLENPPEQAPTMTRLSPRFRGHVELQSVSFRYSEHSPWVVKDVSLSIPPGARIAIVGRSGSGKSTLARVLASLYRPRHGVVLLDGHDLFAFDLSSVRQQIGYVPQSTYLFAGTIRDNIALAEPNAQYADIQRAAEAAFIHQDVQTMPLRYDTPVTSGGGSLSGGQRQRIALARALFRRPPLLILDEATSHLDAIAETAIRAHLQELRCTTIIIAHRLSAVIDCDRIYVLEGGRITEEGTHDQLLAGNTVYAELYASQLQAAKA
jgi:ABC-type bacteriocin/lantibiotic exporter with double-glycine peptidase domain